MGEQLSLDLGLITVRCFNLRCDHTATGTSPDDVHAAMERHYETRHRAWLDTHYPKETDRG